MALSSALRASRISLSRVLASMVACLAFSFSARFAASFARYSSRLPPPRLFRSLARFVALRFSATSSGDGRKTASSVRPRNRRYFLRAYSLARRFFSSGEIAALTRTASSGKPLARRRARRLRSISRSRRSSADIPPFGMARTSFARHPQLFVFPDRNAPACVTTSPPQSHTQRKNLRG